MLNVVKYDGPKKSKTKEKQNDINDPKHFLK